MSAATTSKNSPTSDTLNVQEWRQQNRKPSMGWLQNRTNSHLNDYKILRLENDRAMAELEAHRQALASLKEDNKLSAFSWMVDWVSKRKLRFSTHLYLLYGLVSK